MEPPSTPLPSPRSIDPDFHKCLSPQLFRMKLRAELQLMIHISSVVPRKLIITVTTSSSSSFLCSSCVLLWYIHTVTCDTAQVLPMLKLSYLLRCSVYYALHGTTGSLSCPFQADLPISWCLLVPLTTPCLLFYVQ